MPLNQDVKKRQSKADVRLKIRPSFVSHVFEVTNIGEHRKDGFDDHTHIPLAAPTDAQILRLPIDLGNPHSAAKIRPNNSLGRAVQAGG